MPRTFNHDGPTGPANGGLAITPSDVTVYNPSLRGLYVGGAGNVRLIFENGEDLTFAGIATGVFHPLEGISKVMATSTTATLMIAQKS